MKKKICLAKNLKIVAALSLFVISFNTSQAQTGRWSVPNEAASLKNPIQSNAASIKNGKTLYQAYCSSCHGDKGKGDGPASASLNPKPADHTSKAVQAESDGAIYYKISEGHSNTAMPPFKAVLSADQRWAIVNFMRTLGTKSK